VTEIDPEEFEPAGGVEAGGGELTTGAGELTLGVTALGEDEPVEDVVLVLGAISAAGLGELRFAGFGTAR
jgi:hypothetical protein